MPRNRMWPEEIVAKLRQVDGLTSEGKPIASAARAINVTEIAFCRYRSEDGGVKIADLALIVPGPPLGAL